MSGGTKARTLAMSPAAKPWAAFTQMLWQRDVRALSPTRPEAPERLLTELHHSRAIGSLVR